MQVVKLDNIAVIMLIGDIFRFRHILAIIAFLHFTGYLTVLPGNGVNLAGGQIICRFSVIVSDIFGHDAHLTVSF